MHFQRLEPMSEIHIRVPDPEPSKFSPRHPRRLRRGQPPPLTIAQILAWADSYYARMKTWPIAKSGYVFENKNEMWRRLDAALRLGLRGLERGSSLARLLKRERGVRNQKDLPRLTEEQIVGWVRAHRRRTRSWPNEDSGRIAGTDESWGAVNAVMSMGLRGLPGGDTLPRLLQRRFGVVNVHDYPLLDLQDILQWADCQREQTGRWPSHNTGPIVQVPGRKWSGVNAALMHGKVNGLRGACTLAQLLSKHRGVRNKIHPPPLSIRRILAWADAHFEQTGQWPKADSGPIVQVPGETWSAVHGALKHGARGLPGGSSLVRLLAKHRGVRNMVHPPRLTVRRILAWADAHFKQTGRWPRAESGPIAQGPGENWSKINIALRTGLRGLPGGSSLARLLARRRAVPIREWPPRSTYQQILAWADAQYAQTGRWPWARSGPVAAAPGENWFALDAALRIGGRGLPGGSSVARLLDKYRRRNQNPPQPW